MRKLLKISGIFLGGLVLLVLIAAIALPLLIDINDFKPEIETAAEEATARELTIEGELSLSIFPWLGVEIGRTTMGQPDTFEGDAFASVEEVRVGVRLLPLLRKEVEVDRIEVIAPHIRLVRKADGSTNWEDLGEKSGDEVNGSEADAQTEAGESELPPINIAGFDLTDGTVEFIDQGTEQVVRITAFNLGTGRISLPVETGLEVSAKIDVSQAGELVVATPFKLSANILADPDNQQFGLREAHVVAELATPATDRPVPVDIDIASADADMEAGTASISGLAAAIHSLLLRADASITGLDDQVNAAGTFALDEFVPRQLMNELGIKLPETADENVLGSASLAGTFSATPAQAGLHDIDLRFDDSQLTGEVNITDIESQAMRFDLALDDIDADRYLPPAAEDVEDDKDGSAGDIDDIEIPVDALRGHDVVGNITVGSLKAANFRASNIELGVDARNDAVRLHPLKASFYAGGYQGDIRVDASKKVPRYSFNEHLETVQLAPMLLDLFDTTYISGQARMDIDGSASGRTVGDIRRSLGGSFDARVLDGTLEGFNLWESIRKAYATIKGQPYEAQDPEARTKFTELLARGTIDKGIVNNELLDMRLPFLRANGKGDINIVDETLDYRVDAKIVSSAELEGGMEDLGGLTIPVRLSGPLADPKIRLELDSVLSEKAKAEARAKLEEEKAKAREELERKKEEAKEGLEDKLKKKFKDIFP